jgi:hypothetical protein
MLQALAGEFRTLETKPGSRSLKEATILDFTLGTAHRFPMVIPPAAGTLVFLSQICHANAAIHSAGSDQGEFI